MQNGSLNNYSVIGVFMAAIVAPVLFGVFIWKNIWFKSHSANYNYSRVTVNSVGTSSAKDTSKTLETNVSTQVSTDRDSIHIDVPDRRTTDVQHYDIVPNVNTINTDKAMQCERFIRRYQSVNKDKNVTDGGTQTNELKHVNYRNSMGKPFDVQFVFNRENKTLQIPNSAVTLTLSDADIAKDKECLASTFRNLHDIGKTLQLTEHERVASPAVEYVFVEPNLKEPATVTMPFIGNPEDITVLKMKSDHGRDSPIRHNVLKRTNKTSSDEEFYEIIGPGTISINVKSLSWFVCISCKEKHDLQLTGYLYGRLDHPDPRELSHTLRALFRLYIADTIHCLEDYNQVMEDEERKHANLQSFRLKLSGEITPTVCIRVSLQMDPDIKWGHMEIPEYMKTPGGCHEVLQPEEEVISLSSITGCHESKQSGLPFAKTWYLTSDKQAKKLDCILTTAQKSERHAVQTTNRDSHIVETYLLYDHLNQRSADVKKATEGGNVSTDIVQPSSHVQQPMSAANNVEDPNHPVIDPAADLQHHVNDGLVRGEIVYQRANFDHALQ